jgi:hypothetical protein
MKILKGEASLTLFGSIVKENTEVLPDLDQNLTSDAVHHAIREMGPYDQFQLASSHDLRGTYIDRHITGSMNSSRNIVGSQGVSDLFSEGPSSNRKLPGFPSGLIPVKSIHHRVDVLGARVSVSSSGSLFRGVRLVNLPERFYDTLMPDFIDYARRCPGFGVSLRNTAPVAGGSSTNLSGSFSRGLIYADNATWEEKWGYSVKCSANPGSPADNAPRLVHADVDGIIKRTRALPYEGDPQRFPSQGKVHAGVKYSDLSGGKYYVFANTSDDEYLVHDLLFSNGWFFQWFQQNQVAASGAGLIQGQKTYSRSSLQNASATPVSGSATAARGHRYGILSTRPLVSSAVFRHDKYGQFRDMLEQRLDSRFWSSQDVRGNTKEASVSDAIVTAYFVDQADGITLVSPSATDSSNLSLYATSSIPYIDGVSRNAPTGSTAGSSLIFL